MKKIFIGVATNFIDELNIFFKKFGLKLSAKYHDTIKYEVQQSSQMGQYKRYRVWYKWIQADLDVYTLPIQQYITNGTQHGDIIKGVNYQVFPTHASNKASCFVKALINKICRLALICKDQTLQNLPNKQQRILKSKKFDLMTDRSFNNALIPSIVIAIPELLSCENHSKSQIYQWLEQEQIQKSKNLLAQLLVILQRLGLAWTLSYIIIQSKTVNQKAQNKAKLSVYISVFEETLTLESEAFEAYLDPYAIVLIVSTTKFVNFYPPKFKKMDETKLCQLKIDPVLQILSQFYLEKRYGEILKLYSKHNQFVVKNKFLLTNILTTLYFNIDHEKYLQWCELLIYGSQLKQKQEKSSLQLARVKIQFDKNAIVKSVSNQSKSSRSSFCQRSQASNIQQRLQDFDNKQDKGLHNFTEKQSKQAIQNKKYSQIYLLGEQYQYLLCKKKKKFKSDSITQLQSTPQGTQVDFYMFLGPKLRPQYAKMFQAIKLSCLEEHKKLFQGCINQSLLCQLGIYLSSAPIQVLLKMVKYYLIYQGEILPDSQFTHEQCRHFIKQHINKCVVLASKDVLRINKQVSQTQESKLFTLKLRYKLIIAALFLSSRFIQPTELDVQTMQEANRNLEIQFKIMIEDKSTKQNKQKDTMLIYLYSVLVSNLILSSRLVLNSQLSLSDVQHKLRCINCASTKIRSFTKFLNDTFSVQTDIEIKIMVSICFCILRVLSCRIKRLLAYYTNQELYKEIIDQQIPIEIIAAQEDAVSIQLMITSIKDSDTLLQALNISDYFSLVLSQMINSAIQMLVSAQLITNCKHFANMITSVIVDRDTLCWFCRFIGLLGAYVPASNRNASLTKLYGTFLQIPTFQIQLYRLNIDKDKNGYIAQERFQSLLDQSLAYAQNLHTECCVSDEYSVFYIVSLMMQYAFQLPTFYEYRHEIQDLIVKLLTFYTQGNSSQFCTFATILIYSINKLHRGTQILEIILVYCYRLLEMIKNQVQCLKSKNHNFVEEIEEFRKILITKSKKLTFVSSDSFDDLCSVLWPNANPEPQKYDNLMSQSLYLRKVLNEMSSINVYLCMINEKKEMLTPFFKKQYQQLLDTGIKQCLTEAKNINYYFHIEQEKQDSQYGEGEKLIHGQLRLLDSMIANNNEQWVKIWEKTYLISLLKNKQDVYFLNCYISSLKQNYTDYLITEMENKNLLMFIGVQFLREFMPTRENFTKSWQLLSKICKVFNKNVREIKKYIQIHRIQALKANLMFVTARMFEWNKESVRARVMYHKFFHFQKRTILMTSKMISNANVLHIIHRMYKKFEGQIEIKNKNRKFMYTGVCSVCSYSCKKQVQPIRAHLLLINKIRRAREIMRLDNQKI